MPHHTPEAYEAWKTERERARSGVPPKETARPLAGALYRREGDRLVLQRPLPSPLAVPEPISPSEPQPSSLRRLINQSSGLSFLTGLGQAGQRAGMRLLGPSMQERAEQLAQTQQPQNLSERAGRLLGGVLTAGASEQAPSLEELQRNKILDILQGLGPTGAEVSVPLRATAQAVTRVGVPQAERLASQAVKGTGRVLADERGAFGIEGIGGSRLDRAKQELAGVQEAIAAESEGIVRPRWATGLTNDQLRNIARQEGRNPYQPDWGDRLDPSLIREARQGAYRLAARPTVTALQRHAASLREEISSLTAEERLQPGQIQSGMGIGERPSQGQLLGEFQGRPQAQTPLIDQRQVAARQAREAEIARGQLGLPAAAGETRVPPAAETPPVPPVPPLQAPPEPPGPPPLKPRVEASLPPMPPGLNRWTETYLKLQEKVNDIYAGLRAMQTRVAKGQSIQAGGERDLVTLLTRGPGAANAGALRYRLTVAEMQSIAPGHTVADMNTVLQANHAMDVFAQKPKRVTVGPFHNADQADVALRELSERLGPDAYERVRQAADVVRRVYTEERQRLVDSGFITKALADDLAAKYPWYNPIRYVEFAEEQANRGIAAKPLSVATTGLFRLGEKGLEAKTISPLELLGTRLMQNEARIVRNDTAKAIIKLALDDEAPITKVKGVRPIAVKQGEVFRPNTISFFDQGKRQIYQVPEWMYREAEVLNRIVHDPVTTFVGHLNGISRASFTALSPAFVATNMVIDSLTAFLNRGLLPPATARRLLDSFRRVENDPVFQSFTLAGGLQTRFVEQNLARDIGAVGGQVIGRAGARRRLASLILQTLPEVAGKGEQAPRMALFSRELEKTLPGWRQMAPEAVAKTPQARDAARQAVELTIDFARGGWLSKNLNPWVIFLNASMEGVKLPYRALGHNPAARWRLAGVGAGLAGVTAYNMSYPEYFDVPNHVRWGSAIIMLPSKETNPDGTKKPRFVAVIPKTREWAVFFGMQTYLQERVFKDSPQDWKVFAKTLTPLVSPLNEIPAPEVAMELFQQKANWDFYRSEPIIPSELQEAPAQDQVQPWVSRTVQEVANRVDVSPLRLQHMTNSLFGGAGRAATSVTDYILNFLMPPTKEERIEALLERYEELDATKRRALLSALPATDREALFVRLRQPRKGIPVASSIAERFVQERGGQLGRTGEELAEKQTGISAKQTRQVQGSLQKVSDALLTKQQELDTALSAGQLPPDKWRAARRELGSEYQGALVTLAIGSPMAAQAQLDRAKPEAFYQAVATLGGTSVDRRLRGQILASGWYAIQPEEKIPGDPDLASFFQLREAYRKALGHEDRALLDEELASRQTPIERQYEADLESLRIYFDLGQKYAERNDLADVYQAYLASPAKNDFLEQKGRKYLRLKAMLEKVWAKKRAIRAQNADYALALLRWGFLDPDDSSLKKNPDPRVREEMLRQVRSSVGTQPTPIPVGAVP